jgi:3-oxo-5alpha-steroid 4-dehydrogenase
VRTRTDARAERLVVEADGRVCGVEVRTQGERRRVRARRGVVLASGGFIYDEANVARHAPWLLRCRMKTGTETDDGSGIWMGAAAGGATLRMEAGDITLPLFPPVVLKQGIFVNGRGQRFLNEDAYFGRAGEFALLHQAGEVYLVVDEGCFARPEHFPVEVAAVGESAAELEGELGMPQGALVHTLAYYDAHAARGEDPLFRKRREFVRPLDRMPLAAIDLRPERFVYTAFTLGGLHIDAQGAVRGHAGERVPGLFAAGRTTSGLSKQGYSSGISLGDGSFFGRRAGRSAARG